MANKILVTAAGGNQGNNPKPVAAYIQQQWKMFTPPAARGGR